MLFNSYEFILLFLPITAFIFHLLARLGTRTQSLGFLAIASLFFYGWWNPYYLILICTSLMTNFLLGATLQREGIARHWKGLLLISGLVFNLGLLGYYKYAGFIIEVFNNISEQNIYWENLILPLAISFFTFQQITYLVDSSSGRVKHSGFLEYVVFVTFFPQLIAGPIVHHKEMMPQFQTMLPGINKENLQVGIALFAIGLFKKAVLADSIAEYVTPIYDEATYNQITFMQAWIAGLGFTLQIYFDFSGYSDMALGAARMFGIMLPINFNSPLKASNIIDFWSRWHITLTRFLTAYLFTPLAIKATRKVAMKKPSKSKIRKLSEFFSTLAIPTMITMFISGLWHGAGYQFLVWGCLHGFYLVINHLWRMILPAFVTDKKRYERLFRPFAVLLTLFCVCFAMLFFRADSVSIGFSMASSLIGLNGITLPEGILVQLGTLQNVLHSLGITADATAGSAITYGLLYCAVLLLIALGFPNSHDIMRNYKPALGYSSKKLSETANLLLNNRITRVFIWQPEITWAIMLGIVFAFGIMSLQGLSVFLYWQF
jgi:D-alanyl-lipoteichoic acid acyltransferase DltB (MBOAT superfamily)